MNKRQRKKRDREFGRRLLTLFSAFARSEQAHALAWFSENKPMALGGESSTEFVAK